MIYKTLKIRGDASYEESIDQQLSDGWAIWFMSPVRAGTYYVTFCKPESPMP